MTVFLAGGTGYMGRALARPGSERKLPPGCTPVLGNALDSASFREQVRVVDLASVRAAVEAAGAGQ